MEVIKALLGEGEDAEPSVAEATFLTVSEEEGQVVVTLTGLPDLSDPTWGVILD